MVRPNVHTIESEPFAENTYVVWLPGRADCVVVDPGFDPAAILDFLGRSGLTPAAVLDTHGHVDHIAGNKALKAAFPDAPLVIGHADAPMLTDAMLNLSGQWGFNIISPPADVLVADEQVIEYAGLRLEVRDAPGHSPGHVVYVVHESDPPLVLGGDVLFAGGVGRTDFPGGSFAQLEASIRAKLWPLPDGTIVLPGHGPPTTVGEEKRSNPFVGGR
ncbi:MAG: MBL fold metallo-hydrolase [Gemmataceae bacterium]